MSNSIDKIKHQSLLVFVLVYGQYTVQCTIFLCGNIFPIPGANVKKLTVTVRRSKRTRFTFFPFRIFSFHILLYTVHTVLYILPYTVYSTVHLTVHRIQYGTSYCTPYAVRTVHLSPGILSFVFFFCDFGSSLAIFVVESEDGAWFSPSTLWL